MIELQKCENILNSHVLKKLIVIQSIINLINMI